MSVLGTFGSFGIARLAIYSASSALSVTGNNIANINTTGYCRQYLSTSAMYQGGADQLASGGSLNFGAGVRADAIHQYRDIYMDIRYRDENTNVGEAETKLSGLTDLAYILDEVASGEADFGIIEAQFSEIVEQLQALSEKTNSEEYDTLVRSACETLVQLFNSYADKLDTVADNTLAEFVAEVDSTNILLNNIRDLNEEIRNAEIYGDMALTLRDQRNLYIDELSNLVGIDVYYSEEDIGMGLTVENVTIKLAGTKTELVNGIFSTQLSLEEFFAMPNPAIDNDGNAAFDSDAPSSYMYIDNNGGYTNDPDLATAWLNPAYPANSDLPWLSAAGVPVGSAVAAGPQLNSAYTYYSAATTTPSAANPHPVPPSQPSDALATGWDGGQYAVGLWDPSTSDWVKEADGSYKIAYTTNDIDHENGLYSVIELNNNVEGEWDNAYIVTLAALTSSKGAYMKDDYNRDITASTELTDTVLTGALQAYRELLTEEGEYSSKLDIAMDSEATVKRGIPYYQMALDSLAQKFAESFNTINNLNLDDMFAVTDDGVFMDVTAGYLFEDDGVTIQVDADGNPMYKPLMSGSVIVTVDNMADYEELIFEKGVRDPNYMTDENGYFLTPTGEVDEHGAEIYEQLLYNNLPFTAAELTVDHVTLLESSGIDQAEYYPEDMFKLDDEGYVLDVNGNQLLYDGDPFKADEGMTYEEFLAAMDGGVLTDEYSNFQKAGNLFSNSSNSNDTSGITASNISVSRDWSIGNVRIVTAKGENPGTTDNSNILKFVSAMDASYQYDTKDIATDAWTGKNEFFNGSFQGLLTNTVSTLAQDMQTTTVLLTNYEMSKLSLDNARLSVSGVDLNEEATNMMTYQKAYVAAAKLMTTLDEVLQVLLNM